MSAKSDYKLDAVIQLPISSLRDFSSLYSISVSAASSSSSRVSCWESQSAPFPSVR